MTQVMRAPEQQGSAYQFASQPKALKHRKKYRDPCDEDGAGASNIMWDRRVVRGNTYALKLLPAAAATDPIEVQRQQEQRRRAAARARARDQLKPRSPEAVDGRQHNEVQTELYLEELSDRIEEADVEIQTDAFLDRPPTPLFVPAKSGADVATEIGDGDLFNFDVEVTPVLEVLVGKTIEQSLLEVMEEEELASLRKQQREYEELRSAELAEQQRLEEQERRHREEKERRMKQMEEILTLERETAAKIAAKAFAQSYLGDLVPAVYGTLSDAGYFYDPTERDLEQDFLPWLMDETVNRIEETNSGRTALDVIIRQIVNARERDFALAERERTAPPADLEDATEEDTEGDAPPASAGLGDAGTADTTTDKPTEETAPPSQPDASELPVEEPTEET